jgi:GNAT superfamily N-acetyltransferase
MSDVYILEEYQGKGLGTWLLGCVDEVLRGWKELRRVMLMTSGAQGWYERVLGVRVFEQGRSGLVFMNRKGEGSVLKD